MAPARRTSPEPTASRYFRALQDARRQPGALAADFQLIVVDNDLPSGFDKDFNIILIDPDRPLIRRP